jgi:hypothetical protein
MCSQMWKLLRGAYFVMVGDSSAKWLPICCGGLHNSCGAVADEGVHTFQRRAG